MKIVLRLHKFRVGKTYFCGVVSKGVGVFAKQDFIELALDTLTEMSP